MKCPVCGCKLERDDEGLWYCWKCDRTFWYNPFSKTLEDDNYVAPAVGKEESDEIEWSDL